MSPLLMMAASAFQKAQEDAHARQQAAIQMQMHGPGTENMPNYEANAAQLIAGQNDTPINYGSAFQQFAQSKSPTTPSRKDEEDSYLKGALVNPWGR